MVFIFPCFLSAVVADPGNDERYVNYVQDVEVSLFETCIRSLAHGKVR